MGVTSLLQGTHLVSTAFIVFSVSAGILMWICAAMMLWPHVRKVDFAQLFDSFVDCSRQALIPCACLGVVIAGVGVFMWGLSSIHGHAKHIEPPADASAADLGAIKFQHQNYDDGAGNFIYVYCDTLTGDRIYVLGDGTGQGTGISIVPGGCK